MNTFTYIIIVKDTCAKAHGVKVPKSIVADKICIAKKVCSPLPIKIIFDSPPSQNTNQLIHSPIQIVIPLNPATPKSKYIATPVPPDFNMLPAHNPLTFFSGIALITVQTKVIVFN